MLHYVLDAVEYLEKVLVRNIEFSKKCDNYIARHYSFTS